MPGSIQDQVPCDAPLLGCRGAVGAAEADDGAPAEEGFTDQPGDDLPQIVVGLHDGAIGGIGPTTFSEPLRL